MAGDSFHFRVIVPAGVVLECYAKSVKLPSELGQLCVLPQHTKFTGILGTGILEIEKSEGGSQRMVISGGVCTFVAGTFTVLADSADTLDSVDRENYSAERQELKQLVDQGKTLDPEWAVARAKLARIEAIDELIAH